METLYQLHEILAGRDAPKEMADAAQRVSERYRQGVGEYKPGLNEELDRDAYLAVRMPATSTACAWVLRQCAAGLRAGVSNQWTSLLDLGSGPGRHCGRRWMCGRSCSIYRLLSATLV